MGEEYPEEEDAGDAYEVDAKNCSLSGAIRGVGARSIEEETTEVSSGCRIKGSEGPIGNESNGSESKSSDRPGSGTGKGISWLQDEPLAVETCPSMIPSGCVDCQTSTGEWSGVENLRYVLGSKLCFFKWVLKEDDRRMVDGQPG
jgi:hypothetical protein